MNRRAHNVLSAAARCGLLSVLLVLTVLLMHTQPAAGPNTRAMPAVMSAADQIVGSGHAAARDTVAASLSVGDPAAAHGPAMPGRGCEGAGTMCQADRVRAHLRFLDGPRPVHRAGAAPVAADASAAVRPAAPAPTAVRGSPRLTPAFLQVVRC